MDLSTAASLRARIEQIVRGGARRLVVDLNRVGFMDSSGLSVLVAGMKAMGEAGGEFAIVCSSESILKVFSVTGLDRVLAIHTSVTEATGA